MRKDINIEDIKLQAEEVESVKRLCYNEFINLFYSDEFCNHAKEYKDWVSRILKEKITNK